MKRPLGWVALLYAAGLLLAEFFPLPLTALFVASLTLTIAALLGGRARLWLLMPLIVCVAWTNLTSRTAIVSPPDVRRLFNDTTEDVAVRGTLLETPGARVYVRDAVETSRTLATLSLTSIRRG